MEPTLKNGDKLIFEKIMNSTNVEIDDIVLCSHPFKKIKIIKRVKSMKNGLYFLKGDNPNILDTSDSRTFGPLKINQIIGKLVSC
tara:strand:+ start:139 stop:393 length:255 start_codon:yes stop_codon:yes gene_type:complete